jgi:hypothetical protein
VDAMVALLTDDAWLTMPPLPHAYQGRTAIAGFLQGAEQRRGAPLRVVLTRVNSQPAFGCYLPQAGTEIASAFSLFVLTLEGEQVAAITWFADKGLLERSGLPATVPQR